MNPALDSVLQNSPVPQDQQLLADMDVWEPPFERWMHLVDSLLGSAPASNQTCPKPQKFPPFHQR